MSTERNGFMDEEAAAKFLGVKPGTLSVWRSSGKYNLPFMKIGHLVRYKQTDLEDWMASRTFTAGAKARNR